MPGVYPFLRLDTSKSERSYSSSFCETVFQQPIDCDAAVILAHTGGASGTQPGCNLRIVELELSHRLSRKESAPTCCGVPLALPVRSSIQGSCRKTVDEWQIILLLQSWFCFVITG